MMRPRRSWTEYAAVCALALCTWLSAAPAPVACDAMMSAEYQDPPEWVELKLDRSVWDVAYRARLPLYARKEYIKNPETLREWTELITWNATFGNNRIAPKAAQEALLRSLRSECPNLQSRELRGADGDLVFEWWHSGCSGRPAQHEIVRLLVGPIATHTIAFSHRGDLSETDRGRWVKWISELALGERLPADKKRTPFEQAELAVWTANYAGAVELLRPLVEKGQPDAQELYARLLVEGWGVSRDFDKAREFFLKAAPKNPQAAYNLGRLYENGMGVKKDPATALRWYREAAERGVAEAQGRVGFLLATGATGQPDRPAGYRWFEKAAAQGQTHASYWLAKLTAEGGTGNPDPKKAQGLYGPPAREGEPEAQYELGVLCARGQSPACGEADAKKWLMRATMQGHEAARQFYLDTWGSPRPAAQPPAQPQAKS